MIGTTQAGATYHAQFGEDCLLHQRFFPGQAAGTCVEVGAGDGERYSNTLFFEGLGWRCLLIEANPEAVELCRARRSGATVVHAAAVEPARVGTATFTVAEDCPDLSSLRLDAHGTGALQRYFGRVARREVEVPARTLDEILGGWGCTRIDFITIDVEGHELGVLRGFDLRRWRPRVVIVERNGRWPQWRVLARLLRAGYRRAHTTGVNDWYVRPADPLRRGWALARWLGRSLAFGQR